MTYCVIVLLLEYERELKKINDSLEENNDNPFVKQRKILQKTPQTSSSAIQVSKERTQESTKVVSIPAPETKDNPFLIIKKPEKDNQTDEAPKLPLSAKSLVSNFKNAKDRLLSRAKDFLGTPYGFGSKEGMRTDCSGFTQQVYKQFGVNLPRSAAEQSQLELAADLAIAIDSYIRTATVTVPPGQVVAVGGSAGATTTPIIASIT